MKSQRRKFIQGLAATSVLPAMLGGSRSLAEGGRRPNILVLLADDMGYADLGCFGSRHIRTPNLDRLAAQGVRLTNCYANSPVCSPTRLSLMTGRYNVAFRTGLVEPFEVAAWDGEQRSAAAWVPVQVGAAIPQFPRISRRCPRCCARRATGLR